MAMMDLVGSLDYGPRGETGWSHSCGTSVAGDTSSSHDPNMTSSTSTPTTSSPSSAHTPTVLNRLKVALVSALTRKEARERRADRLAPPCSPIRPRSSSVCSVSIPDTKKIVQESLGQGLPIIPFGFPSFVIVDVESDQEVHSTRHNSR